MQILNSVAFYPSPVDYIYARRSKKYISAGQPFVGKLLEVESEGNAGLQGFANFRNCPGPRCGEAKLLKCLPRLWVIHGV